MKALSFLQPWAFACLYLGKRLDNRRRKDGKMPPLCKHRGPLLLHASGGKGGRVISKEGERNSYFDWSRDWMIDRDLWQPPELFDEHGRPSVRGGIVGRCTVVAHCDADGDIFDEPADGIPWRQDDPRRAGLLRWHMEGSYGLILADVEPLHFVPWKGALGIFNVPDDYATRSA